MATEKSPASLVAVEVEALLLMQVVEVVVEPFRSMPTILSPLIPLYSRLVETVQVAVRVALEVLSDYPLTISG